jgi:predicted dehydrogenase
MINENWRWQAWYRRIYELMEQGRIGRPFFYSIATRQRDGLGDKPYAHQPYFSEMPRLLVIETLVHHLDTARFLMGDITEVYCQTERLNPVIAAEDAAIVVLKHAGGVRGVIDGNRAAEPEEPGPAMETARFEGFDSVIRLRHSGGVYLGAEQVFSAKDVPGYRGDSCRATQQHFVDCLRSDREFESEGMEYLKKTFAVVEACYRSAAENRPVRTEEIASTA